LINSEVEKIRLALLIEYNGKNLVGWQKQNNGKSVQGELEKVAKILFKIDCLVQGAGRTDAGVNASGQVAHIDIPKVNRFSNKSNVYIITAFNSLLIKTEIRIISIQNVSFEFNARFSAIKRAYKYKFLLRSAFPLKLNESFWHIRQKLNINNMKKASKFLIGKHDFTSFRSQSCQALTPIKTIDKIDFNMERNKNILTITIEAKSFLHNQVRIIIGSLIKVGLDIWQPNDIEKILKLKSRDAAGETAPAYGLFLTKVEYPKNLLETNWPMNLSI